MATESPLLAEEGRPGIYTDLLYDRLPEWVHDELSWEILTFKCIGTILMWNSNDHPRSRIWIFNGHCASWAMLRHQLEQVKFIRDSLWTQGVRDGQRTVWRSRSLHISWKSRTAFPKLSLQLNNELSFREIFWNVGEGSASKGVI